MKRNKRKAARRFFARKLQPSVPIAGVGLALLLLISFPATSVNRPPVHITTSAAKHAAQPVSSPKTPVATTPAAKPPTVVAPAPVAPKPAITKAPTPAPVVTPSPSSSVNSLVPVTPPATSGTSGSSSSSSSGSSTGSNPPPTQPVSYTSTNWSGYMAAGGNFTGVSGDWTVPTASGNGSSTSADATWIGIGGVTSGDLIQVGTDNSVSPSGQVSSEAFYELLPDVSQPINGITVAPGDHIAASLIEQSSSQWSITITDLTSNTSFTTSVAYSSSHSSAEWIEEDPSYTNGQLVPFDNFGSVAFSGSAAVMNGTTVNLTSAGADMITMVKSDGTPQAVPSAITNGTDFTITRE